jgi:hypothetical protein
MSEMMISDAAKNKIQHIFCEIGYEEPVAVLYESADAGNLLDDINDGSLISGRGRDAEDKIIERFRQTRDQLNFALMVGVDDRARFEKKDLFEVGNITFVMAPKIVGLLKGCTLIFENDRFLLRGPDDLTYTLLSSFILKNAQDQGDGSGLAL